MKKLNKKGFTLIEVVLVLAIGGLIFLLAFIAFQQVSRNRRDTQRRADASRIVAELQNYQSDKSTLPADSVAAESCTTTTANSFGLFLGTYLCKLNSASPPVKVFAGPQGNYTVVAAASVGSALAKDAIRFKNNSNCKGGTSGMSVEVGLETGSICRDDQ